jgi:hypothetical protein
MSMPASPAPAPAPSAAAAAKSPSLVASLLASLDESDPASFRYLLLLRFVLVNLIAGALLAAAWLRGWVDMVLAGDSTNLIYVIALVFAFGLVTCASRVLQTSAELNQVKEARPRSSSVVARYLDTIESRDGHSRAIAGSSLKLKLGNRIAPIRHVAGSLVFLGLIGTVVGFIIALSGVEPDAAADVKSIGPMVSTLISGMSVALYTTLVGAILNIWLMLNYRLLENGTVKLLTAIVDLGERHGSPRPVR